MATKKKIAQVLCSNHSKFVRLGYGNRKACEIKEDNFIRLTEKEEKLFEFLLDVVSHNKANVILRVAGGWVRDKLLGKDSSDIDIAVDTMTGADFANLINAYEVDHEIKSHSVGVIKANPEQSKHLETATMELGEIGWVDFVNLRAETYSETHRIPVAAFGSPYQDAERRDFTINSLFYNICSKEIEDYTNHGLADLRSGIIRTPLDPQITFLEDPLRVLRAIRFASKLDFALTGDLAEAIQLKEVKDALVKKVSRERVGKELMGMLGSPLFRPKRAFELMHGLKLLDSVFLMPERIFDSDRNVTIIQHPLWDSAHCHCLIMCDILSSRFKHSEGAQAPVCDKLSARLFQLRVIAAFFYPFSHLSTYIKKTSVSIPYYVMKESLKLPNRDAQDVEIILNNCKEMRKIDSKGSFSRVEVAKLLRKAGFLWEACRDIACVSELSENLTEAQKEEIHARYDSFSEFVTNEALIDVWTLKPLLTGTDVIRILNISPGPRVKEVLDHILEWQIEIPGRTKEECLKHFTKTYKGSHRINLSFETQLLQQQLPEYMHSVSRE